MFTKLKFVEYKQCPSLKNFPVCGSAWNIKKDGPFPVADDGHTLGRVGLEIRKHSRAPLAENCQKILMVLTGCDSMMERPRLSLVVILEINKSMEEDKLKKVKTAMLFVIKSLSFGDRLAIVTSSAEPRTPWPLKEITESSQKELEDLVDNLEADVPEASDLEKCIRLGLDILKEFCSQDVVAMMLVSSCGETSDRKDLMFQSYDPSFGNVAVHTLGFGEHYDLMALRSISLKSKGGTFSDVTDTDNLTKAFAVRLAGLLTVAAQDLTLTITPIKEQSRVAWVSARQHSSEYNEEYGSYTIKFGDLYSREVRAVAVKFYLSDVDKEGVVDALKVSCSYKLSGVLYEPSPVIITVIRSSLVSADQQKTLPEIKGERTCIKFLTRMNLHICSNEMSDIINLIKEFLNGDKIKDGSFKLLISELKELYIVKGLRKKDAGSLRCAASSFLSSHERQRVAARGDHSMEKFLSFATPAMLKFLEQAKKFDANPGSPLTLLEKNLE